MRTYLVILGAIVFAITFTTAVFAETYYYSQLGDNSNPGTRAEPWGPDFQVVDRGLSLDDEVILVPVEDLQLPPVLTKPICDDVRITYYISYHADGTTTNHNTLKEALESSRSSTVAALSTENPSIKLNVTGALYETRCRLP